MQHQQHRRGPWSNAEDSYLMQLVQTHGPLNWVRIAQTLGSRTPKQCRERYHQNLKPSLSHDPITPEEGAQIERLVGEIGKRWAEIARRIPGRSDNAVKNWWNGSQNRLKRQVRRAHVPPPRPYDAMDHYNPAGLANVNHSNNLHRIRSPSQRSRPAPIPWAEGTLPSPCASESPECESGNHYAMSSHLPAPRPSLPSVELPPLRRWPGSTGSESSSSSSTLPSLTTLASTALATNPASSQYRAQLPTAPSSPVQYAEAKKERDSRMNLSALLG